MNSRERLEMGLNHKEPDRLPADLGRTVLTTINRDTYRQVRQELGLPKLEVRLADVVQQVAVVDDDVRDDIPNYTYFYDEWGIGWKMPKQGGLYYDMFDHEEAYDADMPALRRIRPWLLTPEQWLRKNGWENAQRVACDDGRTRIDAEDAEINRKQKDRPMLPVFFGGLRI